MARAAGDVARARHGDDERRNVGWQALGGNPLPGRTDGTTGVGVVEVRVRRADTDERRRVAEAE